jgi:hypothetical protein
MLDYLALICLLALCVGHFFLIRGCFKINHAIPSATSVIDTKMAEMNNLLNEACEVLIELADGKPNNTAVTATGGSIQDILTTFLMNKIAMSQVDASTQEQEWPIHQIDPTTQKQAEDERSEHSTEPIGA